MANKCKKGYKKVDGSCVRNSSGSKSKKKRINYEALWIIISVIGVLAIVGLFYYGGSHDWFKSLSVINDNDIINYLTNQEETGSDSCSLDLTPNSIYFGDRVTGTIVDGKNTFCQVFAFDGTTWSKVFDGYTDSKGVLIETRNINVVGNFIFRAICDLNGNNRVDTQDCLTNSEELTVIDKPSSICSETDGGNNIDLPGITTFDSIGYMDYCLPVGQAVHEYWCDGDVLKEENYACDYGETCVSTRSGGYCQTPIDEGYDVGDNVGEGTVGSGSASFGEDLINEITMDWTTGGPYVLGAKITRSWNYIGDGCEGPEQYPMEWTLYDSNGMRWQKYDYVPVNNIVDIVCPVTYHEDAPWKFVVSVGVQACDVSYYWHVQPYICEMN